MKMNQKTMRMLPMSILLGLFAILTMNSCSEGVSIEDFIGVSKTDPYDPSKPVTISGFTPESGGVGQQMVISGTNFGNDTSLVKVVVGGKDAVLVSVKSNVLYCFVPSHAFFKDGAVEVTIGDNAQGIKEQTVVASEKFNYERKMVVGTLCGYKNERDDQGWSASGSSFSEVTGFRNDGVMQFSPYNHNQLFVVYDREPNWEAAHAIQLIDLEKKTVTDVLSPSMFNNERMRTIDFTVDPYAYNEDGTKMQTGEYLDEDPNSPTYGQVIPSYLGDELWVQNATPDMKKWREHLIVTVDCHNDQYTAAAVHIVDRDPTTGEFNSNSPHRLLAAYNQCNGAAVHPVNGEIYFNSYTKGEMLRLDMNKYWKTLDPNYILNMGPAWSPYANQNLYDPNTDTETGNGAFQILYKIQDNGFECQIDIHPEGKYAYIVVINKDYMLKTDYNEKEKRFTAPYSIAGQLGQAGLDDAVGTSAKLARPYQGTFAPNDEYIKEGREDIYDFFFCDSGRLGEKDEANQRMGSTIRVLTPEGIVSTYAGGGANTHADGLVYGNENGELRDVARFHRPTGLVSDLTYDVVDAAGKPTRIFYILDTVNRQIRTIGYEHEDESDFAPAEPTDEPVNE